MGLLHCRRVGICSRSQSRLSGYVWGAPFLALMFIRAFLWPSSQLGNLNVRRLGLYWAALASVAVLSLGLHVYLVYTADKILHLGAYHSRSSGNEIELSAVLDARKYRIEMMFTGPAILIGKYRACPSFFCEP